MTSTRPRTRLFANPSFTVALLVGALGLTAALTYQAQTAVRSHQVAAEGALSDYASFAMWELEQRMEREFLGTMIQYLIPPVATVDPARPERWPTAAQFAHATRTRPVPSPHLGRVHFFFRYDWRAGALTTSEGSVDPEERRWVRDTIVASAHEFPPRPDLERAIYGSPDLAELRKLSVVITNDSYVAAFGPTGSNRAAVFVISRDDDGAPVVTYGFVTDADAFLRPITTEVLAHGALLPPSLTSGLPTDSVLQVHAHTPGGEPLFRSVRHVATRYVARDTMDSRFGHLVLSLAIRPDFAPELLVGGLPKSRLPMLVGLLLLTAALVALSLFQLRRQQEFVQLRTRFVSGVSHELRTPLAQIRLFAQLLQRGTLRTPEERARAATIIDEESQRLTFLVENVLSFSRDERGIDWITPVRMEVAPFVHESVHAFLPLAHERRAAIATDVPEGLFVRGDDAALRQVLFNLLDNALKYGPPGQTVLVGARALGDRVQLSVRDEGTGIAPADRERIWERYVRLEGRAARVGGTGIGLTIVRTVVERHGGRVWVEDAPGGGAQFMVELERMDGYDAMETAAPAEPSVAGSRENGTT